ncbi:SDR family oxidoreductase [Lapillicoccus sp.]|uniref:SDR family NAD(P)-dependent oxidoreductase n=1 Tax=Lapillicoccus sp. TaxID=1909287 RepID=UPI0032661891
MTTALVTGASAGIGHEFARQLAERGHDVVLVARDRVRLENVSDELRRAYRVRAEVLVADLSDRTQMEKVAQRLSDAARPIDLLVNNAGYGQRKGFLANEVEQEENALDLMCTAVLVLTHAAARSMKARGRGGIINVSSVASYAAMGTYSAAKAWVRFFSEGLAQELHGSGVTVMALCPGFTHTEFHDRGKLNMSHLPEFMWLEAPAMVRQALDDAAVGKVVSVPGAQYKTLVGLMSATPRGLVRNASATLHRRRRTKG